MSEEICDFLYLMRHPNIVEISNPQGDTQVCEKTIVVGKEAQRQVLEFFWMITEYTKQRGITDLTRLRSFDHIYSTPTIRGLMSLNGLPEGIEIRHRFHEDLDYQKRKFEKELYYNSLRHWTSSDRESLYRIIRDELDTEILFRVKGIQVLDGLSESLEIEPKWTGAAKKVFHREMEKKRISKFSIKNLHEVISRMLYLSPEESFSVPSRRIFAVVHGSSAYCIRESIGELINGPTPSLTLLTQNYGRLKHDSLIPHGCGLEILIKRNGEVIEINAIDITEAMEGPLIESKTRMFLE